MPISVERSNFDPESGYEYRVCFARTGKIDENQVHARVPVEVAVSVGETGELADMSFEMPKGMRTEDALSFIRSHSNAQHVGPRIFVVFPEANGDAVVLANGRLEIDAAGRIIGMEIAWSPRED